MKNVFFKTTLNHETELYEVESSVGFYELEELPTGTDWHFSTICSQELPENEFLAAVQAAEAEAEAETTEEKETEEMTNAEKTANILTKIINGEMCLDPNSGNLVEISTIEDAEPFTLADFFNEIFRIEYRVESRHAYTIDSVWVRVDDNITIDTDTGILKFNNYDGKDDKAFLPLGVIDEINELFSEMWNC